MKIEIDLDDILGDEYGPTESLAESIKRQVIDTLVSVVKKGIDSEVRTAVDKAISESIATHMKEHMPAILDDILNTEFTPVDNYGRRGEPTSFKSQLIKHVQSEMVFKKDTSYSSDRNSFTKAVLDVVESETKAFQKEFNSIVTKQFTADTLAFAITELRKRLNI